MIRPAAPPIHLDTSFLIRALERASPESVRLREWLGAQHGLAVSTLAWAEFECGPLGEDEEELARRVLRRFVPVGLEEASAAARLFNHGGRRRNSLSDCIIAATAILDGARLATSNPRDFERFADAGLELATPPPSPPPPGRARAPAPRRTS